MEENTLKKIIAMTTETIASIAGAGVGLVIAGPVGACSGAAIAPVLSSGIKEFTERWLSNNESEKIGCTYVYAIEKIKQDLHSGRKPRNDNFFTKLGDEKSDAQVILEGTLVKSKNEYEDKKLIYYSKFLANIGFEDSINFEKANVLLRLIEQLSYRQLVILGYLFDGRIIDMSKWDSAFKRIFALEEYFDFYSEMTSLYNMRLLCQCGDGIKLGSAPLKISPLGSILSKLMELDSVSQEEKNAIDIHINCIQLIIK